MSVTIKIGATQTGGTDLVLTNTGDNKPGEVVLSPSTSTRLLPKVVKLFTNTPVTSGTNPGSARAGLRVILASRVTEEGCCTVTPGTLTIDLSVNWPLSQPESLVDEGIAQIRGLVFSPEFVALVKSGRLPT